MNARVFYDHCQYKYQPKTDCWRNYRQFRLESLDANTRQWLLNETSLTQRLIKASNQHFRVHVVNQRWQRPTLSEAQSLNVSPHRAALIREVLLMCHGKPWVFARSVIPASTLTGRYRCLKNLQERPLGQWLFNDKTMRRHSFQIAQIAKNSQILPTEFRGQQQLWGRRSKFELSGKPLLVCEIFLPDFIPDNDLL